MIKRMISVLLAVLMVISVMSVGLVFTNAYTTSGFTPEANKLYFDADGNGEIESVDATFIQRWLADIATPFSKNDLLRGDIDGSGDLELTDVTVIQYYLANMKIPYNTGELIS